MFAPSLFCLLLCVATTFASLNYPHQLGARKRATMQDKVEAFVESLNLPSSQANALTSKLEGDSNLGSYLAGKPYLESGLVSLACLTAQLCFGSSSVETSPVNQTTVDGNWSVVWRGRNHQTLTMMIKV